MIDLIAAGWEGYELIDSGEGKRLERFGPHTVVRPDPNIIWVKSNPDNAAWSTPDLEYLGKKEEPWKASAEIHQGWDVAYGKSRFLLKPTSFRHVGLFPEQQAHWDWIEEKVKAAVKEGRKPKVLNLFAYTGASSVIAARAGAQVTHVDASKASVYKARENGVASGLAEDAIRWIVDDVLKFMLREVRRGNHYDMILMDPPVFGRGPKGEIWRIEVGITELAVLTSQLLTEKPIGVLANVYATALYPQAVLRVFEDALPTMKCELGCLSLKETSSGKLLPTGYFVRA
ncbi:MAG: class I SAM-dependent methyltransferase [bacterium]